MKLDDIIALSKAGFKRKEILQYIKEESEKEDQEAPEAEAPEEDEETLPFTPEEEEEEENELEKKPETKPETPDYKAMFEKADSELKKLQKKEVRQKMNPDKTSDQDRLNDLIKNWF